MKRIYRTPYTLHLVDILKSVEHILICNDITTHYKITASEDPEEMSDDSFYLTLTDSQLNELTDDEIYRITNPELLERIAKFDISRLSLQQRRLLKSSLEVKYIVDRSDVEALIKMLKECNSISYDRGHQKTNRFLNPRNIKLQDCLDIIHQLTVSDYVATSKSYNPNHIGNHLFIFETESDWEIADGVVLEDLSIYIKLDIDETTKDAVALVSFHAAEYNSRKPYQ